MDSSRDGSKSGVTQVFGASELCKSGIKADLLDLLNWFKRLGDLTLFDLHTLMIRLAVKQINYSAEVSSVSFVNWCNCSDSFVWWLVKQYIKKRLKFWVVADTTQ